MYHLPHEIQIIIYEFDNTYKIIMDSILKEIPKYKYFTFRNFNNTLFYYVYCPQTFSLHMTNSLKNPSFISSSYNINYIKMKYLIRFYNLVEAPNLKVEFDIENNVGQPYLLDYTFH